MLTSCIRIAAIACAGFLVFQASAFAQGAIDNSALSSKEFREHKRTFGLVYTLPAEINDLLARTIGGPLREKLLNAKLYDEAQRFNIPHVTVLHIHNSDPTTPEKMMKAMPKLPGPINFTFKTFYTTEAAKGAGHPWWLDLGIVKEGPGYEAMMAFNALAVPALTPLRDGPLPRVTGPVYAVMSDAAKELVQTVGSSGSTQSRTARSCVLTIRTTHWSTRWRSSRPRYRRLSTRPPRSSTRSSPTGSRRRSRPSRSSSSVSPVTCCARFIGSASTMARCSTSRRERQWRSSEAASAPERGTKSLGCRAARKPGGCRQTSTARVYQLIQPPSLCLARTRWGRPNRTLTRETRTELPTPFVSLKR